MTFSSAALQILIDAGPELMHSAIKMFNEMGKKEIRSADIQALPKIGDKPFIDLDKSK